MEKNRKEFQDNLDLNKKDVPYFDFIGKSVNIFLISVGFLILFFMASTVSKSVPSTCKGFCDKTSVITRALFPVCANIQLDLDGETILLSNVYEVGYTDEMLFLKFASESDEKPDFAKAMVIPKSSIISKRYRFGSLSESPPKKPKPEKAIKFINNSIVTGSFESTSLTRGFDSGEFFPPPAQFSCFENGKWIAYIKHLEGSSEVFPQCSDSSNKEECKELSEHNKNEIVSLSNKMSSGDKLVSMSFASSSGSSSGNMDITQKRAHAVFDAIDSKVSPNELSGIVFGIENFIGRGEDSPLMTKAIKKYSEIKTKYKSVAVNKPFSLVSICSADN